MPDFFRRQLPLVIFCACACAWNADAQTRSSDDPVNNSRIRFGPIGLTPSITLGNLGVDKNVFNDAVNPKEDYTGTVSPEISTWLRAGPTRLNVETRSDFVYYRRYASQRSLDGNVSGRYELRSYRLNPWISAGVTRARQRSGYEIDLRSRRELREKEIGMNVRVRPKTYMVLNAHRADYVYSHSAFLGSNLDELLNRRQDSAGLAVHHDLTPLTTFVVDGEARRDRFKLSPGRDADSVRVRSGFDLSSFALVSGRVRIGYRTYDPLRQTVRPFRGIVASANVASTLRGRVRVSAEVERDIEYSYLLEQPYYLLTGATVDVTHRFTRHFDVQARGGRHALEYRETSVAALAHRSEVALLAGGGIGFRTNNEFRVSVNAEQTTRNSSAPGREHQTLKIWTAVTYGR
jgi:hypothetical protein